MTTTNTTNLASFATTICLVLILALCVGSIYQICSAACFEALLMFDLDLIFSTRRRLTVTIAIDDFFSLSVAHESSPMAHTYY